MNMIKIVLFVTFTVVFISNTATADQQKLADRLLGGAIPLEIEITSCNVDAKKYCSGLTINSKKSFLCLMAYEDSLTKECNKDILKLADIIEQSAVAIEYAMKSCNADASKHCFDVKAGEGRVFNCLMSNVNTLSKKCTTALTKIGLLEN